MDLGKVRGVSRSFHFILRRYGLLAYPFLGAGQELPCLNLGRDNTKLVKREKNCQYKFPDNGRVATSVTWYEECPWFLRLLRFFIFSV